MCVATTCVRATCTTNAQRNFYVRTSAAHRGCNSGVYYGESITWLRGGVGGVRGSCTTYVLNSSTSVYGAAGSCWLQQLAGSDGKCMGGFNQGKEV